MAHWLAVVGGTLIVRSEAGRGTTVTGTVPVDRSGLADET
jgi:signal transduction histidine kinase